MTCFQLAGTPPFGAGTVVIRHPASLTAWETVIIINSHTQAGSIQGDSFMNTLW